MAVQVNTSKVLKQNKNVNRINSKPLKQNSNQELSIETEDKAISNINSMLDTINTLYTANLSQQALLIQNDKQKVKSTKEEAKAIVKNKKKNTEKKQKVNDFNIDSYEIYLNSVLSNLNNVEERNLKWTEVIEKTCHIAHNILSSLKDNKKQLEVQNDPHKASAILQDMQTQIKILNSMQKTIKQQVELQKMEKEAKRKKYDRIRTRRYMARVNAIHAAIANARHVENAKLINEIVDNTIDTVTDVIETTADKIVDQKDKEVKDKEKKDKSTEPTSLFDKNEINLNMSMLSPIVTQEFLDLKNNNKHINKNLESQNSGETLNTFSKMVSLSNKHVDTQPNEIRVTDSVKLYMEPIFDKKDDTKLQDKKDAEPATNDIAIIEKAEQFNKEKEKQKEKEKEQDKEKEQENKKTPKEILIAEIKGNKYVIFKKTEDGRCEQIEDGTLFADKNGKDGEYILYPKPEKEEDMPSTEKVQQEQHLVLVVNEGQQLPLNKEFKTELIVKNKKSSKDMDLEETKKATELVDKKYRGKSMSFTR